MATLKILLADRIKDNPTLAVELAPMWKAMILFRYNLRKFFEDNIASIIDHEDPAIIDHMGIKDPNYGYGCIWDDGTYVNKASVRDWGGNVCCELDKQINKLFNSYLATVLYSRPLPKSACVFWP